MRVNVRLMFSSTSRLCANMPMDSHTHTHTHTHAHTHTHTHTHTHRNTFQILTCAAEKQNKTKQKNPVLLTEGKTSERRMEKHLTGGAAGCMSTFAV